MQTTYTKKDVESFAEDMISEEKSLYNENLLPGLSIQDAHKISKHYLSKLNCAPGSFFDSEIISNKINMSYIKVETAMQYLRKEGIFKTYGKEGHYTITRTGVKFIEFLKEYKNLENNMEDEGFDPDAEIPGFDENLRPISSE